MPNDIEQRIIRFRMNMNKTSSLSMNNSIWLTINGFDSKGSDIDLIDKLKLFGNSSITIGVNIHDYKNFPAEELEKHINIHQTFIENHTTIPINTLTIPNIFNVQGRALNDMVIPITSYRIAYYISQVLKNIHNVDRKIIVELGGGWGLGAYITLNNRPNTCYIIIDLPSTSILSAWFLLQTGKNVLLFGEFDEWNNSLTEKYDIIIVPPEFIEKFDENFADVTINTASLTEMSEEYIDYYVKNIAKITKIFYEDNHTSLASTYMLNCFNKYLTDFDLILSQETPINYTTGLWDYYPFIEKIYKKRL
jgi:hypothetical protein